MISMAADIHEPSSKYHSKLEKHEPVLDLSPVLYYVGVEMDDGFG
jgi:hypothetical protein